MSMDSQLTSLNPQSPPRRQCGHIPTLRLVEGSSAEVADRVHAVGEWLTTWAGETAVLDNAVGELKAARKQVSRRPECGRPKDDEATRDAKREQLLEWVLPVAEHLWNEVQSGPTLEGGRAYSVLTFWPGQRFEALWAHLERCEGNEPAAEFSSAFACGVAPQNRLASGTFREGACHAICAGAAFPVTGKQVREAAVLGSISYTERIGRAIREANAAKRDAIAAILEVTNGALIFRGKIVDVQRRTSKGWALGECVLEGMDSDTGARMVVRFQNENLVAIRDDEIIASVPDLITIIDAESGQAITTEYLRYGFRVVVLGIPCDPKWRTPAGIELGGPRHFRYDIDYVPLEQRFAMAGRADGRQVSGV